MRFVSVCIFIACFALPARGQTPDTTAAWRYFPLEVGNEWQYHWAGKDGEELEVWAVTADTLVNDQQYFRLEQTRYGLAGEPLEAPGVALVRFDTAAAAVHVREAEGYFIRLIVPGCPLDAPFGSVQTCEIYGTPHPVGVYGGYDQTLAIGPDTLQVTLKGFDTESAELYPTFAASIGLAGFGTLGGGMRLTYARVGGAEYGRPRDPVGPRYFPLAVGNVWEYEQQSYCGLDSCPDEVTGYRRLEITGDTTVGGRPAWLTLTGQYSAERVLQSTLRGTIRYELDTGYLVGIPDLGVESEEARVAWAPCPLSAVPDREVECELYGYPAEAYVENLESRPVPQPAPAPSVAAKYYHLYAFWHEFGQGVGLLSFFAGDLGGYGEALVYARVDGVEYGTPFVVADEAAPAATAFTLGAPYPNPAHDRVTLDVALPAPGALTVEAFDVLGRRVWRQEETWAVGPQPVRLDVAGWAAGVYLVRATHGDRRATARLVVR